MTMHNTAVPKMPLCLYEVAFVILVYGKKSLGVIKKWGTSGTVGTLCETSNFVSVINTML